jgi:hypothetical protein
MASSGLPAARALPRISAGVIDDARRHGWRRRRLIGVVIVATVATGIVALQVATRPQRQHVLATAHGSVPTEAPSTVLSRQPWIGNACPGPYSKAAVERTPAVPLCDRVGLMIEPRKPAVTATATINGQTFKLDDRWWSYPPFSTGKHTSLAGFLQHARFLYGPFKTITFRNGVRQRFTIENVHLVIDYGAGHKVQTSIQELGYGGWG